MNVANHHCGKEDVGDNDERGFPIPFLDRLGSMGQVGKDQGAR